MALEGVTVAVKVTACPSVDGFREDVTTTSSSALVDRLSQYRGCTRGIVCIAGIHGREGVSANRESGDREVAAPLLITAVPREAVPSMNCTLPW